MAKLIDGRIYKFPDGALAQAVETESGQWQLWSIGGDFREFEVMPDGEIIPIAKSIGNVKDLVSSSLRLDRDTGEPVPAWE